MGGGGEGGKEAQSNKADVLFLWRKFDKIHHLGDKINQFRVSGRGQERKVLQ